MKRISYLGPLLLVPAVLLMLTAIPGCPGGNKKTETPSKVEPKTVGGVGEKSKGEPFVVENTDGIIKGRVVFDGTPPERKEIAAIDKAAPTDKEVCLGGDHRDQTWIFGKDNGVANVVVTVEPPEGKFFAMDKKTADDLKKPAFLDQPHCVYEPHVIAMFAAYKDKTGTLHATDEKFEVKNSGPLSHNTKILGDGKANGDMGKDVPPKSDQKFDIKYQKKPLPIVCDKHNWMKGVLLTFDNPFFAVTDKDGNFEIKGVPAGSKLTIKTWHETKPPPATETVDVKKGVNDVKTLKIKAAS